MMRRITAVLAALFLLAAPSDLVAHEGHDHTVMGTLTMAAADHVMLRDTDGKDQTFLVTEDTKVTRDNKPMRVQDIRPGTRVVVTAVTENNRTTAREIQVGPEP